MTPRTTNDPVAQERVLRGIATRLDHIDELAEEFAALGQKLLELRLDYGLSQKQLAELAELDQSRISLYERGLKTPQLHVLRRIAGVYGTSVSEILEGVM